MHKFIGTIRLGKDAEARFTPNGKGVVEFSGAYDVGYGENKRSQWIKVTAWREKPESLANMLKKGQKVAVVLTDVHNHDFDGRDGKVVEMRGTLDDIDFLSPQQPSAGQQPARQQQPAPQQQHAEEPAFEPDF